MTYDEASKAYQDGYKQAEQDIITWLQNHSNNLAEIELRGRASSIVDCIQEIEKGYHKEEKPK